jgi:hypothetical protein
MKRSYAVPMSHCRVGWDEEGFSLMGSPDANPADWYLRVHRASLCRAGSDERSKGDYGKGMPGRETFATQGGFLFRLAEKRGA